MVLDCRKKSILGREWGLHGSCDALSASQMSSLSPSSPSLLFLQHVHPEPRAHPDPFGVWGGERPLKVGKEEERGSGGARGSRMLLLPSFLAPHSVLDRSGAPTGEVDGTGGDSNRSDFDDGHR